MPGSDMAATDAYVQGVLALAVVEAAKVIETAGKGAAG